MVVLDIGFVYIVSVVGIDVLGIFVVSNFNCFGFYNLVKWCVNCYLEVFEKFIGKIVD